MNVDYFMMEALIEAKKAIGNDEIPVGGVLVDNDTEKIITRSYNKINMFNNGIRHCELNLIIDACKILNKKYLNNTTMFVTLEPCSMCASAISEVHIDSLYFGAYDEKNGGIEKNKLFYDAKHNFKTEIYGGVMEINCKNLLEDFFKKLRK